MIARFASSKMTTWKHWKVGLAALVGGLFLTSPAAHAAMIVMSPDPVSVLALDVTAGLSPVDFTLLSGDSGTNVLEFGMSSTNPGALFFDQVTIMFDVMVTSAVLTDAGTWTGVILNVFPISADSALVELGFENPGIGMATFEIGLASTPTLGIFSTLNALDSVGAMFDTAEAQIPEPTGVLLFGAGMLVVGRALRRRAA